MKKVSILLMLLICASFGFASGNSTNNNSAPVSSQMKNVVIDLGDITSLTDAEVSKMISERIKTDVPDVEKLQCSITITAKMTCKYAELEASVTVSGDCDDLLAAAKGIARRLLSDLRSQFIEIFE